jgi:hypothetical protein
MRHEVPKINGGAGALRAVIEAACAETDSALTTLTVLSSRIDPYRLDTSVGHVAGKWAAAQLKRALKGSTRMIHWRGLHYVIVAQKNIIKPNGEVYTNTDENWTWLIETAGKAARWLGYVPFEKIFDNKNDAPIIHRQASVKPDPYVSIGLDVAIPDASALEPTAGAEGFVPRQAYHFVFFGEKGSLKPVLEPIAKAKHADLYLPSGEISDTLLHQIAKDAVADGRPMVMFTLADCDPGGHQMPVSIGRKLQAFRDLLFPSLRFEVVPVALTVAQVEELGLPSTPLKETEKRADRWREAFGVEQTEIDALAALRPRVLTEIVEAAFEPYYDSTLEDRVAEAETEWLASAQEAIDSQMDPEALDALRAEAADKLAELQSAIDDINERLHLASGRFTLPPIVVPEPEIDEDAFRHALLRFGDDWVTGTRALITHKSYGNGHDHD